MIALLFSSFITPGTFFTDEWDAVRVIDRVIARVESADVTFHNVIYIVTFDEINKTVRVHYFTFLVIHRQHIIVIKFVQTYLGYVKDAHTHVN